MSNSQVKSANIIDNEFRSQGVSASRPVLHGSVFCSPLGPHLPSETSRRLALDFKVAFPKVNSAQHPQS